MGLTKQEQIELQGLLELEYKDQAKDDYATYVEYAHAGLYTHVKHTRFICNEIQKALDKKKRMLDGEIPMQNQYIALSMPPRHSKSMSITETLPSYYLGLYPNHRVIIGGYNTTFAEKFGKKNREKIEQFGEKVFGISIKKGTSSATDWDIEGHRGGVISRGVLSGVTGEGSDLQILDDIVKNREEANSQVYRDKVWGEWVDSFSTRLHPCAIVVVIMTRWHEDDLVGRLLNPEYGEPLPWKVINLPMEAEEDDILGRKIGEPLWEERYGYDYIETRKRYPSSWNALFQGRPTSMEGNLIKREWWKYYTVLPIMMKKLISVDAAFKGEATSDFVSIQVWGKRGVDIYLIDSVKRRMDFPTTLQAVRDMVKKHPDATTKLVEDKANGSAIIAMLRREIGGIIAINPQGGKIARVHAVSPHIESGNVYIPHESIAPWITDFVEECSSFPKGKNDDQVDCMSQALNRFIYHSAQIPHVRDNEFQFNFMKPKVDAFRGGKIDDSYISGGWE